MQLGHEPCETSFAREQVIQDYNTEGWGDFQMGEVMVCGVGKVLITISPPYDHGYKSGVGEYQ